MAAKGITLGRKAFEKISAVEGIKPPLPLNIEQGDTPPAPEVLAQALVDLAAAWKQFQGSRLRRATLVLLLHDASGVGKTDIRKVLDALDRLETNHVRPA